MNLYITARNPEVKIWTPRENIIKIKKNDDSVTEFNLSHIIGDIEYKSADGHGFGISKIYRPEPHRLSFWRKNGYHEPQIASITKDITSYPDYLYLGWDQTETDEPATQTVVFPPRETPLEFIERISARLFYITHRIAVLRHEEPHQNALSEDICREVPADHDEVLRYDISNNLIKRAVGWVVLQMETYETRYNRYLESVETAKRANRAIPTFNDNTDRNKIETMVEKIEDSLTEECLRDHFDLHNTSDWDPVQNTQRKITLCNDDANRTPGEVLVDVNSFFTDGRGRIAHEHAKKTYHDISTLYWVKAKRTSHRTLVTERTVESN